MKPQGDSIYGEVRDEEENKLPLDAGP